MPRTKATPLSFCEQRTVLLKRFEEKYIPVTESGCWLWIAALNDKGYGQLSTGKKVEYAHRLSFEWFKGAIPYSMEIDHLCRVRCCVNPDHLEAVTRRQNQHRGIGFAGLNARKVACLNGHAFTPENTYYYRIPSGRGRMCLACAKARRQRYHV
jgi:hypothetical protein